MAKIEVLRIRGPKFNSPPPSPHHKSQPSPAKKELKTIMFGLNIKFFYLHEEYQDQSCLPSKTSDDGQRVSDYLVFSSTFIIMYVKPGERPLIS